MKETVRKADLNAHKNKKSSIDADVDLKKAYELHIRKLESVEKMTSHSFSSQRVFENSKLMKNRANIDVINKD